MRLYKYIQGATGSHLMYEDLVQAPGSAPALVGGHLAQLDCYKDDPEMVVRKRICQKIIRRYYSRTLFTRDQAYFANRLFWKLNEIMPTFAARYASTVSSEEFAQLIADGLISSIEREKDNTDNGNYSNTGTSGNTMTRGTTRTTTNTGTVTDQGTNSQTGSLYPGLTLDQTGSYAVDGSSGSDSNTRTDNTQQVDAETGSDSNTYTQNLAHSSSSAGHEEGSETRTRNWTPAEIAAAKEKLIKLVYNLEEEIVNAVSDCFNNVGWGDPDECDEDDIDIDEVSTRLTLLVSQVDAMQAKIDEYDFDPSQKENIDHIPEMREEINTLTGTAQTLIQMVEALEDNFLPDVTDENAGDFLIVNFQGKWVNMHIPNTDEEGY